jgi:putative addiction module component (TIGR02574 family)
MMRDRQTLLVDALALPEDQRADLVLQLSESLEPVVDEDAEDEWARTVARRVQEVRDGTAMTVSVDDAFQSARKRLADRRGG